MINVQVKLYADCVVRANVYFFFNFPDGDQKLKCGARVKIKKSETKTKGRNFASDELISHIRVSTALVNFPMPCYLYAFACEEKN